MSPFKQSGLTCRKHSNLGTNLAVTTPPEIIEIMMLEKKNRKKKSSRHQHRSSLDGWRSGGVGGRIPKLLAAEVIDGGRRVRKFMTAKWTGGPDNGAYRL